eukprot:TRINITY_DN1787_c0_g1_i1.p1 TRINITY_DN1787_c0_g1~~TRINITY_DN1787_c0_g1_i1.p1  ORF type:complete len:509 (+),score=61.40 TRINITY_DN1787_c0_g1_i1:22-1527(+)
MAPETIVLQLHGEVINNAFPVILRLGVYVALFALVAFVVEQLRFYILTRKLAISGPKYVWPLVGGLLWMIRDPFGFWERQRQFAPSGLSWNSLCGMLTVFVTDPQISHNVLAKNGPEGFDLWLHPNGKAILGANNIAFLHGAKHKELRASFLGLFTSKALGIYLKIQERCIRKHMEIWLKESQPLEMRNRVRDLNLETSQSVFVGQYIENPEEFGQLYLCMVQGFLCAPIYLPGTGLWNAVHARRKVIALLTDAAKQSKKEMAEGKEPTCLLDFWSIRVNELLEISKADGSEPPFFTYDAEMAHVIMDFLFASQDASTASLTWVMAILGQKQDVQDRVREEQFHVRPTDVPCNFEMLKEMPFTHAVAKELLRYRPPAPMMPTRAAQEMPLSPNVTVPKGSLVIASIWGVCRQGFPEPEAFDPDRMMPERKEDLKYRQFYIPFGSGPHHCVGYNYAIQHLAVFLSIMVRSCSWRRIITPESEQILYLPTIYPKDSIVELHCL